MKSMFRWCLLTLLMVGCQESDFQAQSLRQESLAEESEATADDEVAAEPVAIGGSYLRCVYSEEDRLAEINCRLEKNEQPILFPEAPPSRWRVSRNLGPVEHEVRQVDITTGWQWSLALASPGLQGLSVHAAIVKDGHTVGYEAIPTKMESMAPTKQAPPPVEAPTDQNAPLGFRTQFGHLSDFVVGTKLNEIFPSRACVDKMSGLPLLKFVQKGKAVSFTFTATRTKTLATIRLKNICGQKLPTHVIEIRGPNNFSKQVKLPSDVKDLTVVDRLLLPEAGLYKLSVRSRSEGDSSHDAFIFDHVTIESDKLIRTGHSRASQHAD